MEDVAPEPGRNAESHSSCVDSTVETSGVVLRDGRVVDLICDGSTGESRLLICSGARIEVAGSVGVEGQTLFPVTLDPGIRRAITFPAGLSDYGSTETLFSATREVLTRHGMSEDVADAAVYFVFSTWFPERLLPAPCLVITGPSPEATMFLQLLGCLVRRGLSLIQIGSNNFWEMAGRFHPTFLIDGRNLNRRSLCLLSSCGPRAFVPWKRSVVDLTLPKAIYFGAAPIDDFSPDFSVHVHLLPSRASASMLDEKTRETIITDFQPRFLNYRLNNFAAVRDSVFDLPDIGLEGRVIARMLGACIVDSQDTQAGIRHLLQHRDDELCAKRWTDLTCVVIEVLLAQCHDQLSRDQPSNDHSGKKLHVNEIAKAAEVVLKGRGAPTVLEPRAVGGVLDRLSLYRTRDARGRLLVLAPDLRRMIHILARNHQVASTRDGAVRCDLCKEIFEDAAGK